MTTQSKAGDFRDGWEVREQAMASLPLGLFLARCGPRHLQVQEPPHRMEADTASWSE